MSVFSVLAFVCVAYTDGTEHCDVRSKVTYISESRAECWDAVSKGIMKVADTVYDDPEVENVTAQEAYCYDNVFDLQNMIDKIPAYMEVNGRSYVLTRY